MTRAPSVSDFEDDFVPSVVVVARNKKDLTASKLITQRGWPPSQTSTQRVPCSHGRVVPDILHTYQHTH
jgi:hypothetical protein